MSPEPISTAPDAPALRAEHDALAKRLEARRSIDEVRKALYELFFGLISAGLAVKLAFDRWGPPKPGVVRKIHTGPPLFFYLALAVTIVVLLLAIRGFLRTRRLMREEDALFARYRTLRATLGLDR
jgi:hypothetical protein